MFGNRGESIRLRRRRSCSGRGDFSAVTKDLGEPDVVVYNASNRVRGPITEIDPDAVLTAIKISCYGGFLVAQQAAKQMVARGNGTILFTGASAGVKGYPNSTTFAIGKFGLRGLAQALARELHPQNIHIGHFVIDGGIRRENDPRADPGRRRTARPGQHRRDLLPVLAPAA